MDSGSDGVAVTGLVMAASAEVVPAGSGEAVDLWLLAVGLLGGLALFLHGMDRMTESLRMIAGDRMRDILRRFTDNRLAGMFTGAGVTALIQSSSVTTVLVVGFISSGLMTLEQSIGVIVGPTSVPPSPPRSSPSTCPWWRSPPSHWGLPSPSLPAGRSAEPRARSSSALALCSSA